MGIACPYCGTRGEKHPVSTIHIMRCRYYPQNLWYGQWVLRYLRFIKYSSVHKLEIIKFIESVHNKARIKDRKRGLYLTDHYYASKPLCISSTEDLFPWEITRREVGPVWPRSGPTIRIIDKLVATVWISGIRTVVRDTSEHRWYRKLKQLEALIKAFPEQQDKCKPKIEPTSIDGTLITLNGDVYIRGKRQKRRL